MADDCYEEIGEGRWLIKKSMRVTRVTLWGAVLEPIEPVDIAAGDEIHVSFGPPPRISIHKVEVKASGENFATVSLVSTSAKEEK